ncbi:MAG: GNAT family N-acetyltransferase [Thermomonas sp.]|uniref:GNAT family N-acetyltransferase n=1 Tax=Thermomonas sp. TaxID=1971895 RepID=UPI0039E62C97
MAARNRMPPWHENVRLANGRELLIRPIRPEDAEPLRAAFVLLEPDEVRQRFLHQQKELGADQAQRLTHPNPRREFALVAAEPLPPGEALVGAVARISIDDNGKDAEFAILVSHYINGMGLGRHLMRRLVRWAKGRKVQRIYGDVLENNLPMQSLAQSLGFSREFSGEPGLVRVVLDLPPPKPKTPPPPPLIG